MHNDGAFGTRFSLLSIVCTFTLFASIRSTFGVLSGKKHSGIVVRWCDRVRYVREEQALFIEIRGGEVRI